MSRIHHLEGGCMCPYGGAAFGGEGPPWRTTEILCHCLLVEGSDGLTLIETGFGTAFVVTHLDVDHAGGLGDFPGAQVHVRRGLAAARDACFHHGEMRRPPECPGGLRVFQNLVGHDRKLRMANQERLRELVAAEGPQVDVLCAHDPHDFARF